MVGNSTALSVDSTKTLHVQNDVTVQDGTISLAELYATVSQLQLTIASMNSTIQSLQASIAAGNSSSGNSSCTCPGLAALNSTIQSHASLITNLQTSVASVNTSIQSQSSLITGVQTSVTAVNSSLSSRLQGTIKEPVVPHNYSTNGCIVGVTLFYTQASASWSVPSGVTRVKIELYGAGGSGFTSLSPGQACSGGGGAYCMAYRTVTVGQIFTLQVGNGTLNTSTIISTSGFTATAGSGNTWNIGMMSVSGGTCVGSPVDVAINGGPGLCGSYSSDGTKAYGSVGGACGGPLGGSGGGIALSYGFQMAGPGQSFGGGGSNSAHGGGGLIVISY